MANKNIYSIFMLIVFLIVLYFSKQKSTKLRVMKKLKDDEKSKQNIIENEIPMKGNFTNINHQRKKQLNEKLMFDHPSLCFDVQIFLIKFIDNEKYNKKSINIDRNVLIKTSTLEKDKTIYYKQNNYQERRIERDKIISMVTIESGTHEHSQKPHVDSIHGSNSIVYIFVIFLVVSLIRAALDLSNQMQKNKDRNQDDFSRRCSLQEFAQSRHNQRKNSKKKVISRQGSCNTPSTPSSAPAVLNGTHNILNRLIENTPAIISSAIASNTSTINNAPQQQSSLTSSPSYQQKNVVTNTTSNLLSEPSSPAKNNKLLGARPVPLIRRSSFPISMGQPLKVGGRRPSMDSFSEGDSSPDVKRRVRMIHRH